MPTIFESERLLFREFNLNDAPLIYELNSDPEVIKYVHEKPTTLQSSQIVLKEIIFPQYALYHFGRWAIHLKNSLDFIGWCGLKFIKEKNEIDLGYRFKKKYWNKGYATEAVKTCIRYGFEELHIDKIIAKAHEQNISSLNVIEKCNMQFIENEMGDNCLIKKYELTHQQYLLSKEKSAQECDATKA